MNNTYDDHRNDRNAPVQAPVQQFAPPTPPPAMPPRTAYPPQPALNYYVSPTAYQNPPPAPGVPGYGPVPPFPQGGYPVQPPASAYPATVPWKERENYKTIHRLCEKPRSAALAVFVFLFAVLFCEMVLRSLPLCGLGISVPVTTAVFYIIALWYLNGKDHPAPDKAAKWLFIPVALIALSFAYIQSGLVQFVNIITLILLVPIHLSLLSGYHPDFGAFSPQSYRRAARTTLSIDRGTFGYLETPFSALHQTKQSGKSFRRHLLFALLGLLAAIPAVIIFASLLSSYDAGFAEFIDHALSFLREILNAGLIFDIIFGFGIACLLAPMIYCFRAFSSTEEEPLHRAEANLESAATAAFLVPVVLLHLIFTAYEIFGIISKSGFSSAELAVSSAARRSFAALVIALGLGFVMVLVIYFFNRRRGDGTIPVFIRFLLTVQILCGFVILGFAVYHSIQYSLAFGLTSSRISAYWLMAIMGLCFVWMIVKIWRPKFRLLHFCSVTVLVLVLLLNVSNPDVLSAKFNVDRYLSGATEEIDVRYLSTLSPSAVPQIARLLSSDVSEDAVKALSVQHYKLKEGKRWSNFSFSDIAAWNVLRENGINTSSPRFYYSYNDMFDPSSGDFTYDPYLYK